jgi:hypothetical protein
MHNSHVPAVGSKAQVYKGHAKHTSGGLKKDNIQRVCHDGQYHYVSKKKHVMAEKNNKLALWRQALRDEGFMIKGDKFKKAPKKGTKDYEKVKRRYDSLLGKKKHKSSKRKSSKRKSSKRK